MLNAIARFLLLYLQAILISLVVFFFLGCYADYVICCPFFEKKNHQLRTEPSISILPTKITSNIFSYGKKSMFTNITSTRTCIILTELNPRKHGIWVNTSFSHFFLSFERCSPAELEGRTPQHKIPHPLSKPVESKGIFLAANHCQHSLLKNS